SPRAYPETLPPVEHDPGDETRKVSKPGWVHFRGRKWRAPKAFEGERIAFRPSPEQDGVWEMRYGRQTIGQIDLREPQE
ncbi:MAG: IS481 family transposase, partial [Candidatus Methylomirabilis sp.]|nr:IS481 family transposase [Deltaproteobacteria bacterium]